MFLVHSLLLGSALIFQDNLVALSPERLYYLNSPESIRSSGVVAQFKTPPSPQKIRVFFHFVNRTSISQEFVLHFDKSMTQFRLGYGISYSPGFAGQVGVKNFMSSKLVDKFGGIKLSLNLKPGCTISGICDGETTDSTNVVAYLGSMSNTTKYKVLESSNVNEHIDVSLNPGSKQNIRIGNKRKGMIDGDYGTSFNFLVKPNILKPSRLKIVVSPRGGHASFGFSFFNIAGESPLIGSKNTWTFYDKNILPGEQLAFSVMLPGGYSYPLEYRFSIN